MESEISVLQVEKRIRSRVKRPDGEDPARVLPDTSSEGRSRGVGDTKVAMSSPIWKRRCQDQAFQGKRGRRRARIEKLRQMSPMSAKQRRAHTIATAVSDPVEQEVQGQEGLEAVAGGLDATITGSRRSRTASSSISRCSRAPTS